MPQVTDPKQLFKHELQDMYYAEKTLATHCPSWLGRRPTRSSTRAFTAHQKETEKHVSNLEKVFKQIGESARAHPCPGIEGIKREHDDFMKENSPSEEMRDAFLTGAAARAEHYEIAAYTGLVNQARALGEREAVALLQENLKQGEGGAQEGGDDLEAPTEGVERVERLVASALVDLAWPRQGGRLEVAVGSK